jgi:hypothetical protein
MWALSLRERCEWYAPDLQCSPTAWFNLCLHSGGSGLKWSSSLEEWYSLYDSFIKTNNVSISQIELLKNPDEDYRPKCIGFNKQKNTLQPLH